MNPELNPGDFEYIGDGVYVTFDGCGIWAMTMRVGKWHKIFFDPEVMDSLVKFFQRKTKGKPE